MAGYDYKVNANGRVSLHLVNILTGACVYDLDCNPSEVPERVWVDMLCSGLGDNVQAGSQLDHIHQMRMHEWYGFELVSVWQVTQPYVWVWQDDNCENVDNGPDIWIAEYKDTAKMYFAC